MKSEKKIRNALIKLYWEAHSDGGLAEFDNNIGEHLRSQKWADRRAQVIGEALRKIESAQQPLAQPTAGTVRQNSKSESSASSVKAAGTPSGG